MKNSIAIEEIKPKKETGISWKRANLKSTIFKCSLDLMRQSGYTPYELTRKKEGTLMTTEKSIYKNASSTTHALLVLSALLMIGFSIYLTSHYFEVHFPQGLSGNSLCEINSFLSCGAATHSALSNIAGIPISVFGVLIGLFILGGYLFSSDAVEETNYLILGANAVGCLLLFFYSLFILKSLCPFCTLYYIFSFLSFYLFYKNSSFNGFHIKTVLVYGLVTSVGAFAVGSNSWKKADYHEKLRISLIKQFNSLKIVGDPKKESPHRLNSVTSKFQDAPLRITIFSDFQCPACKQLAKSIEKIIPKYKKDVNIQYMFYPLDMNCNPSIKKPFHGHACTAAFASSCLRPDQFLVGHDEIFEHQDKISRSWIKKFAEKYKVTSCYQKKEVKEQVVDMIKKADEYNIKSTPTLLINGRKIEGVLLPNQLSIILDNLLKKKIKS
jgi:protein-disulfide isomerase/uncharacterized membrane protein